MPIAGVVKINGRWPRGTFDSKHEQKCYHNWNRRGLNEQDFDHAYKYYIESVRCDWCKNEYINSTDKQMDHCHIENTFRNILCQTCNLWRNESTNICKIKKNDCKQGFYWQVQVKRNGKKVFQKTSIDKTVMEEALAIFKDENPLYFPFHYPFLLV